MTILTARRNGLLDKTRLFGRGYGTWVNFCWVCVAILSKSLPLTVYSVADYRHHLSHFW